MSRRFVIVLAVLIFALSSGVKVFGSEKSITEKIGEIEQKMLETGDYSTALKELDEYSKSGSGDARFLLTLGIARYGSMEYTKAYENIKKAAEGALDDGKALAVYATSVMDENRALLLRMEADNNALAAAKGADKQVVLERLTEGHYKMLSVVLAGEYYYPSILIAHISWLRTNAPDEMTGMYALSAGIYYSAMIYDRAAKDFEKAALADPNNAELAKAYADCLVAMGDFDKAEEVYEKAAAIYRKAGAEANASKIAGIERVKLALPRSYKDASRMIAGGEYDKAEAALRKRLSLNGGDYVAVLQLGQIRWEKGDRKEAMKFFAKSAKMAPDYPTAHLYLGKGYAFARDTKKAMAEFKVFKEKMDRLPPMDEDTVDFYVSALHYVSYLYSLSKDYKEVINENGKILKLKPNDQDAHYNLAMAYYYSGKNARAYEELKKVIEIDPAAPAADMAKYCIDYIRSNQDPRIRKEFLFIGKE